MEHSVMKKAIVAYSLDKMYRLVVDVARYPEFVEYCRSATLVSRKTQEAIWRTDFGYFGVTQSVVTKNFYVSDRRIEMRLVEGPFQKLEGTWTFFPMKDEKRTEVHLSLCYQWASGVWDRILPLGFVEGYAERLMMQFKNRAVALYGKEGA